MTALSFAACDVGLRVHCSVFRSYNLWLLMVGLPQIAGAERARRLDSDQTPLVVALIAGVLVASTIFFCTFIHAYYQLYTKHEPEPPDENTERKLDSAGTGSTDKVSGHTSEKQNATGSSDMLHDDSNPNENHTISFGPDFQKRSPRTKDGVQPSHETEEDLAKNMWSVETYSDEAMKDGVPKDQTGRTACTSPGADLQDIMPTTTPRDNMANIGARMQSARSTDLESVAQVPVLKSIEQSHGGSCCTSCCAAKV
mmetsp:Transcript_110086/g.173981  ORF Transcript_110086/g.173981 Transcript_110086/m.173981 type:complete len:255 (-) Transcript_110086:44-808(-)